MVYAAMRNLLDEGKFELSAIFEHGLEMAGQFAKPIEKLGKAYGEAGLNLGGELFLSLARELTQSQLAASWNAAKAIEHIAQLWQYLAACGDRLNYFELLDSFGQSESE